MMPLFALLNVTGEAVKSLPDIIAAASKSPLGVVALSVIALGVLAYVFFKEARERTRVAVFVLIFGGLAAYVTALARTSGLGGGAPSTYRVRAIVLDPQNTPVSEAKVWSSLGGEPMRVEGGWLFTIPAETRPKDGVLTLYAAIPTAFVQGNTVVPLGEDHNPSVSIRLVRQESAQVRGNVQDRSGRAIRGARVSVAGYGNEAVLTDDSGSFALPAHAVADQQVQVRAEADGFDVATQWSPAGNHPVTVVLETRARK